MRTPNALLLVCALILGCSGDDAATASAPLAEAESGGETAVDIRVIQLLEAGAEPRRALRYQVADGQTERLTLEIAMAGAATAGEDAEAEAVAPPVRLLVEVGPTLALPDGSIRYGVTIREVTLIVDDDVDPDTFAAVEAEVASLADVHGSVEVTPLGVTRTSEFDVPENISQRTLTLLGNVRTSILTVPLPEEPVGVGARWEVAREVNVGGIVLQQTVTYTLGSVSGPEGEVRLAFRQSGAPQELSGFGGGVSATLDAYESSGVGTVDFDLTRITPYSEAEVTTQIQATVTDADGNVSHVDVRTASAVAVAPAP